MTTKERVMVWVTKYALTYGVIKTEAEITDDMPKMAVYANGTCRQSAHGKDWHRARSAALARVEEMRKAKVASLRKKLAKLESMTINIPE